MAEYLISKIIAEEIKDSRGNFTIKVTVFSGDISDSFSVPSGASTGAHEAHVVLNDKAILNVNEIIAKALIGKDILNQQEIDQIMIDLDGTINKEKLGGNAMIGVSIACAKTAAKVQGIETFEHLRTLAEIKPSQKVPHLYMNLINGGKHAKNNLVVSNTEDVSFAIDNGIKIQETLKEIISRELGESSLVLGDEGGFAPQISDIRKPLLYLNEAIKKNNLEDNVRLALDVASSSFFMDGKYKIDEKENTKDELMSIYDSLIKEFNLFSIEDPFDEESFEDFKDLKEKNKNIFVVGDDLTVSNKILLQKAIDEDSINMMIIKPNQIGTLTETLETMRLARENDIELIVSHRSGETDDDFIADLAFAFNCFGMKAGSSLKMERMVKYKRLEEIINNL